MRNRVMFLGTIVLFCLTLPASAQQFSATSKGTGSIIPTSIPSFFTSPLAKPDFSAMSMKPNVPGPLNLASMMPSWSNLQNTILLRNVFGNSPQLVVRSQQAPPPQKKKTSPLFLP